MSTFLLLPGYRHHRNELTTPTFSGAVVADTVRAGIFGWTCLNSEKPLFSPRPNCISTGCFRGIKSTIRALDDVLNMEALVHLSDTKRGTDLNGVVA